MSAGKRASRKQRPVFGMSEALHAIGNSDVSASAVAVGSMLVAHMNTRSGLAFPSLGTLQRMTRKSRPTVHRAIVELVGAGLIVSDGHTRGRVVRYRIECARTAEGSHPRDGGGSHPRDHGVSPMTPPPSHPRDPNSSSEPRSNTEGEEEEERSLRDAALAHARTQHPREESQRPDVDVSGVDPSLARSTTERLLAALTGKGGPWSRSNHIINRATVRDAVTRALARGWTPDQLLVVGMPESKPKTNATNFLAGHLDKHIGSPDDMSDRDRDDLNERTKNQNLAAGPIKRTIPQPVATATNDDDRPVADTMKPLTYKWRAQEEEADAS
jgi:hypothetical protein